jgi:hypothetical protein
MTVMDVDTITELLVLIRPAVDVIANTVDERRSTDEHIAIALKAGDARNVIKAALFLEGLLMARKTGR